MLHFLAIPRTFGGRAVSVLVFAFVLPAALAAAAPPGVIPGGIIGFRIGILSILDPKRSYWEADTSS